LIDKSFTPDAGRAVDDGTKEDLPLLATFPYLTPYERFELSRD